MDIEKRIRKAVESLLENESLLEGLDNQNAASLLDWGTTCVKTIVKKSENLADEEEAEETIYPQMRALRQMLKTVTTLYTSNLDMPQEVTLLNELIESAAIVYGPVPTISQNINWVAFSATKTKQSGQQVSALRTLVEKIA
jgi:hypothetical protein